MNKRQATSDKSSPNPIKNPASIAPEQGGHLNRGFDIGKTKDFLEILGKLILSLIALCYVLGLLVVNIHLSKYGTHSMSLFRVNYIAAGIWTLLPILVLMVFIMILVLLFKQFRHNTHKLNFLIYLLLFVLICYFPFMAAPRLRLNLWHFGWLSPLVTGGLLNVYFILALSGYHRNLDRNIKLVRNVAITLAIIVILILHTILFAYNVYENIPSHIGGGKPQTVQIIVDIGCENTRVFDETEIPFIQEKVSNNSHVSSQKKTDDKLYIRTNDIELISVTDEDYVIKGRNGAVTIPRSSVKAVLYKGSNE